MVTLQDVHAAYERIRPYVRKTPLVQMKAVRQTLSDEGDIYLKLENMQVSGSFKARGALNTALGLTEEERQRGLVTASGGNHGMGVTYAGWLTGVPATIYLPHSTPATKVAKLKRWGAEVVVVGRVWDDAHTAALAHTNRSGATYIHPFADPRVIAGQGTIALELFDEMPDIDHLIVAIGGGGLISGISIATHGLKPDVKITGVEPVGAPTLYESLKANHLVELEEVMTAAGTLAPRKSDQLDFEIIQRHVEEIVLVDDEEMRTAARWLWEEQGIAAELSGAAATAAVLSGKVLIEPGEKVCVLVCGQGTDGIGE
uniref:threonine ammonia-lyase n=1 Tax=Thermosporothrix sp. COM3 TaxID=2490863 RepID=A0A455SFF0_9CHLR|nr:serine/threonine dehydratase [Thermosporothrix sp. COM3]